MSNWWQELLRFFLRGLTLQQLIHMLIILIALIIITPASIKEWVDIRNPEILPDHWMYYAMLLCISYVLNRVNRPGFPGEYFICELRLPDHYFRW
ncbi:super-infection exclusion protein B, partial [Escherichia coli]|uniref:super-infection exclusion protein B n=2 Tax=Escherichia coli TaxID=562 RepID=UPI00201CEA91